MNTTYTAEQKKAAAEMLGFENAELMLAYFKSKLIQGGMYEDLRAKAETK